jgi:hypothetical protein
MNIATANLLNDSRSFEGFLSPGPVGAAVVIYAG